MKDGRFELYTSYCSHSSRVQFNGCCIGSCIGIRFVPIVNPPCSKQSPYCSNFPPYCLNSHIFANFSSSLIPYHCPRSPIVKMAIMVLISYIASFWRSLQSPLLVSPVSQALQKTIALFSAPPSSIAMARSAQFKAYSADRKRPHLIDAPPSRITSHRLDPTEWHEWQSAALSCSRVSKRKSAKRQKRRAPKRATDVLCAGVEESTCLQCGRGGDDKAVRALQIRSVHGDKLTVS